jgi:hypothetical protein
MPVAIAKANSWTSSAPAPTYGERVHGQRDDAGQRLGRLGDEGPVGGEVGGGAVERGEPEGVDPEVALEARGVAPGVLEDLDERLSGASGIGVAHHAHGGEVELNVGEHVGETVGGDGVGIKSQPHRRGAPLQVVQDRLPSEGDVGILMQLPDAPGNSLTVADAGAAGERHGAGVAQCRWRGTGRVQRRDLQAVQGRRRQPLQALLDRELLAFGTASVEDLEDLRLPLCIGDRGKASGQGELFGVNRHANLSSASLSAGPGRGRTCVHSSARNALRGPVCPP